MNKPISSWDVFLKRLGFRRVKAKRTKAVQARRLRCEGLETRALLTAYFVDATDGNDAWDGLSETYTSGTHGPWKTVGKVNSSASLLLPGDSVLFQRGEAWREQLVPDSGDETGRITYAAYGDPTAPKPLFLGSAERNNTADWQNLGGNVWSTIPVADTVTLVGDELLYNPSFDTSTTGWSLHTESTAVATGYRDTAVYDTSPAGYSVACTSSGTSGNHIQLLTNSTSNMSLTAGQYYLLTFRAKATEAFTPAGISLHKQTSPWTSYASSPSAPTITTDWATYKLLYRANTTATDARLTFSLGNTLPAGATFSLDTLSFMACEVPATRLLDVDVGNIIFNHEESCGVKRWSQATLQNQGDFWYDASNQTVKLYSTENPASYYSDIELALKHHMISEGGKSYVTYEDLDLRYGAAHGIGGGETHHITVTDCDLSFIGGALQYYSNGNPVRYGNGIEFWNNAHDNLVEGCRISEVYDAALTNQGNITAPAGVEQYNLIYRNNIIWNSEYSFEYWLRPETSTTSHIYFENNTCLNAGSGWGHTQRPDGPNGRHLMFYANTAATDNFYVRNNIFSESTQSAIRLWSTWTNLANLTLDNNLYWESDGNVAEWQGTAYSFAEFAAYQAASGKDAHSLAASPEFVDSANLDVHLQASSPAIDAGANTAVASDYHGTARPQGPAYDIGAYEYEEYLPNARGLLAYWKLDETTGASAGDSYGTYEGKNNGATVQLSGQINTAYAFDGSNDSVAVSRMNLDELSLSAWFYKDTKDTTSADAIFGGWRWSSDSQQQEGYDLRFYQNSPDTLDFIVVTQNASGVRTTRNCGYNLGDSVGKWYHVTATYDKVSGVQTLYVNGAAVATQTHTAGNTIVPLSAYTDMRIGYSRVNGGYFDGRIDEVKVFNRPLSAEEVAAEYQHGSLVAYWTMNENQGNTVYDQSPRGNDATNSGAEWVAGKLGPALHFTQSQNDYVSIPRMNHDELTLSAWFYKDSKDTTSADAVFGGWKWASDVQQQEGYDLRFYQTSPDTLNFILVTQDAGGVKTNRVCSYNLGDSVGQWYHVAATYNKTTGVQTLYVNGVSVSTQTHPAGNTIVPLAAYTDMRIGYSRINNGYFDGTIDNVRVYNRPLTSAEIAAQYAQDTALVLSDYALQSYGGTSQDVTLTQWETLDDGKTLHLWGNTWKALALPTTINANTVLEFDFRSTGAQGEIAGIGVDTQTANLTESRLFELYGTQTWGIQNYRTYSGNGWTHYTIPIGTFFTGSFDYLTFANDADAGQNTSVFFKNIRFSTV